MHCLLASVKVVILLGPLVPRCEGPPSARQCLFGSALGYDRAGRRTASGLPSTSTRAAAPSWDFPRTSLGAQRLRRSARGAPRGFGSCSGTFGQLRVATRALKGRLR